MIKGNKSFKINISDYNKGIYLLKISSIIVFLKVFHNIMIKNNTYLYIIPKFN